MSVAIKKIEGVESVKASLNEGRVCVHLKPGNSIRLEQLRMVVNEQGFTPKEARIKAVGDLTSSNAKLLFKVSGTNELYEVVPTPHLDLKNQLGTDLVVAGLIAVPAGRNRRATIQIIEVSKGKPAKQ